MEEIYDIVVIGGGITGLVASWQLKRQGKKVILLEKEKRLGGNINTFRNYGYIFEEGPQTILASNEYVYKLIKELNLESQLEILSGKSSDSRFILKKGRLIKIPLKPWEFFTSPLLSWSSKLLLFREFFSQPIESDISVAEFTIRHFGEEFYDYFVQPFISGIYAGDGKKLSLKYAFPKLYEIQRKYGSLLKAFLKEKRVAPKGKLLSFRKGLSTLVDVLKKEVPYLTSAEVIKILKKERNLYQLILKGGKKFLAKRIIITTNAKDTVKLLRNIYTKVELLEKINYPPLAVVSLAFRRKKGISYLQGFGFLVPQKEQRKILGAIFVSSLFQGRCPSEEICFSVFLCGETQKDLCNNLSLEELESLAEKEIRALFPVGEKTLGRIKFYPQSIPQYELNYEKFLQIIKELENREPNIKILSSYIGGSSLAKCIEKGMRLSV